MLWTLLAMISCGVVLFMPVVSAHRSDPSARAYLVAGAVGVLLALGNARMLARIADQLTNRLEHLPERRQESLARAVYLAVVGWVLVSAFFADWIVRGILRFLL